LLLESELESVLLLESELESVLLLESELESDLLSESDDESLSDFADCSEDIAAGTAAAARAGVPRTKTASAKPKAIVASVRPRRAARVRRTRRVVSMPVTSRRAPSKRVTVSRIDLQFQPRGVPR
jgi:hypothetical protein